MITTVDIVGFIIIVLLSTILFYLLQPSVIFTLPGNSKWISFGERETNWKASFVHTGIYGVIMAFFMVFSGIIVYPIIDIIL